jgi:hypothetical protein
MRAACSSLAAGEGFGEGAGGRSRRGVREAGEKRKHGQLDGVAEAHGA